MIPLLQAPADTTTALGALNGIVDRLLDYAILLAAVGAVSMALIEVVKKLFDFRARFHAEKWTEFMFWNGYEKPEAPDTSDAYVQLLQLACGVGQRDALQAVTELTGEAKPRPQPRANRTTAQRKEPDSAAQARVLIPTFWGQPKPAYSVFAQSTAQVTATFGDAADVVLASPHSYQALFQFLVRSARQRDIDNWMAFTDVTTAAGDAGETPEERKIRALGQKEAAAALARLRQVAKRRLASFQLFTEQSWASWNQLWAGVVGVVVMAFVLINLDVSRVQTLIGALFGGLLAPVAKDLVDALQRVKSDVREAA